MKSVGIRKQNWFKAAGVVTFAAQILGGAGLARADVAKACLPTPAFVYGGDPVFTSLSADNITKWTGSSGYGWNEGSLSEVSYEAALADNTDSNAGLGEIGKKWLLLAFINQITMPEVSGLQGMKVGFNYDYNDPIAGVEHISQIMALNFDDGALGSTFNPKPPACPSATSTDCANDPTVDPASWTSFKPAQVTMLQKINDKPSTGWKADGIDHTQWIKDHTRVWVWADTTVSPTKYFWRMQMALPIRTTLNDPTQPWASPSIYLDPNSFVATGKIAPPFWTEIMSDATAAVGGSTPLVVKHFPDWAVGTTEARDSNSIPTTAIWGQAEVGSPRDASLLNGDLQCTGQGMRVEGTTGDDVVWHSAIWNNIAAPGGNTNNLFDAAGSLYMLDSTGTKLGANNMSVMLKNLGQTSGGSTSVSTSQVHAQFLIAPYGSQAVGTVWSPLNQAGNDFTCPGGSAKGNKTCAPLPKAATPIDSIPDATAPATLIQNGDAQWHQAQNWIPSANYMCGVRNNFNDAPNYTWYYQNPGFQSAGAICGNAVYTPNDATGTLNGGASSGLPGHQCLQVSLSGNGVQFATKSAFRNMHVAPASLYRETATIDTRGLPKIAGQSYHNIYLYVETHNMPYRVDTGYAPPTYTQAMAVYNRLNSPNCGDSRRGTCGGNGFNPAVPVPSENFFSKTMPTFVVHTYADTGETYTVKGKTVPVLTPLTSFGQFVTHDASTEGNIYGWDTNLEPLAGTPFQKVGVDTYRLQIPNDGAGQVVTHVEPLPVKRPTCSGTVNSNIVALLQAIAPLITLSPSNAGEINALIDSLQIQCVDLQSLLNQIGGGNWGFWSSWVNYLITQIEATDGCQCQ